jgi:hypothetical protein
MQAAFHLFLSPFLLCLLRSSSQQARVKVESRPLKGSQGFRQRQEAGFDRIV